jgi:hypothetical protein
MADRSPLRVVPGRDGLAIVYQPLKELRPYAKNPRTHPREQIAKLRASLARFGWTNPLLIADDTLVAGHARLAAALAMAEGVQPIARNPDPWMAPTIDLSHLSEDERRAYVIADNRLALDGGWNREFLIEEVGALNLSGFDLPVLGFPPLTLDTLLGKTEIATEQLGGQMQFQLVIECTGEHQQGELLEEMRRRGLKVRPLIL